MNIIYDFPCLSPTLLYHHILSTYALSIYNIDEIYIPILIFASDFYLFPFHFYYALTHFCPPPPTHTTSSVCLSRYIVSTITL